MERLDVEEKSICAEEDKKYVTQAVKFVIGHTRNGYVSLCASVATLLKEKANLKLENEILRQQIEELKQFHITKACSPSKETMLISNERKVENKFTHEEQITDEVKNFKFKRKENFKTYKAIKGCLCNNCTRKLHHSDIVLTPPLEKGDRVVIAGEICGTILYVGHIDDFNFPDILVGLHLDEAVGDSNGTINGKTYFKVPHQYGYLVPLSSICCIIESKIK